MVWLLLGLAAALAVGSILAFNSLRRADQGVKKDWENVTVELERRAALLPNLVASVERYATHENLLFAKVTAERVGRAKPEPSPFGASVEAVQQVEVEQAFQGLLAVAEAYPALRATENYQQLVGELSDTEDRIAAARRLYNSAVEFLNNRTRTFPTLLFTGLAGVTTATYFTVDEDRRKRLEETPSVNELFAANGKQESESGE